MMNNGRCEWDWGQPFTMAELFEHFELGNVHDVSRTRPVMEELNKKGYTKRMVKMNGLRKWRYSKWPEMKAFVMPDIP